VPALTMPRLSDSMEEGTIISWLREDGDEIGVGDELLEIDTDKATVVYEAEQAGALRIVVRQGETVRVGATIAHIDAGDGDDESAVRVKASPVSRRLAERLGVELESLTGTGPSGRIVKRDVEAASRPSILDAVPADERGVERAKGAIEVERLDRAQLTIARRMVESRATMPDFTLTTEVDMESAVALRAQLAELGSQRTPSLGDLVIKACGLALREHPRVNSSYRDGTLQRYGRVNIGVAVAAPGALLVPTVFDADSKQLSQIAIETITLAERGRAGKLTPPELGGATFTVSNLGMFGVTQFTAVLNPPQAAILAVGSVQQRAVVHNGNLMARHCMNLTLSCDHRVLYGADAAAFLASVRVCLEQPLRLVL
jgi:pyruvate dehydrogenase E2 component (dihydrolipoamide acetyltransferase)